MKKTIVILTLLSILATSCSSAKETTQKQTNAEKYIDTPALDFETPTTSPRE